MYNLIIISQNNNFIKSVRVFYKGFMLKCIFSYCLILTVVTSSYCQRKYKDIHDEGGWEYRICPNCNGKGTNSKFYNVVCYNCKDWAESYRNIKGCDVCKNNKTVKKYLTKACVWCDGYGKQHNVYWEKKNIDYRNKVDNCNGLKDRIRSYSYPTKLEVANSLIGRKTENWIYESLDEFVDIKIKNELGSIYVDCEFPEKSSYVVNVDVRLFDKNSHKEYLARLKIKFTISNEKWIFDRIISGNISEY